MFPRTILLVIIEILIQSSPSCRLVFLVCSSKPLPQTQFFSLSPVISGAFLQLFEVHHLSWVTACTLHVIHLDIHVVISEETTYIIPQRDGFKVPDLTKPSLHAALETLGLSQCHSKDGWEDLIPSGPTDSS